METVEDRRHAEPVEFVAIIDELEDFAGQRLREPGRAKCLAAFAESPDGFARIALRARRRARTSPFGLLCRMVDDREHLLGGRMRQPGRCVVCGEFEADALRRGGQFWCHVHEEQAA